MKEFKGRPPMELSKLGDPFVNLIYSLALSRVYQRPMSKKVSNRILSEALSRSGLRNKAGSRMQREKLGDYAEGLIFSAFAHGKLSLEDAVETLVGELNPSENRSILRERSIQAFEKLLTHVAEL